MKKKENKRRKNNLKKFLFAPRPSFARRFKTIHKMIRTWLESLKRE
jgi:hypothetical protein